jgi:hypothetical protein
VGRAGDPACVPREHVLSWAITAALHQVAPIGSADVPVVMLACADTEQHALPLDLGGFHATLGFLQELAGPFERDETALLRALDAVTASRAGWPPSDLLRVAHHVQTAADAP